MMNMVNKRLSQIGLDVSGTPFPTDWKTYINNMLVKSFHDQPNLARQLATLVIPIQYDGRTEAEVPIQNDLDDAEIGMEPGIADTGLEGDTVNVKTPQIYQTMNLSDDKWAQLFAGQDRKNLALSRMAVKIKNKEDKYVFQGKTGISSGIIAEGTTLGASAGSWGTATNGKLGYAWTDFGKIIASLDANGIPAQYPIDVIVTSYAYAKLDTTFFDYQPTLSNRVALEQMLRGGKIYQSDNIQASVGSTSNTMLAMVRAPEEESFWALLASGLDIRRKDELWGHRIGIRQKVGVKVLDAVGVMYISSITTA